MGQSGFCCFCCALLPQQGAELRTIVRRDRIGSQGRVKKQAWKLAERDT